jgi:dienelactone hydrolase
MKGRNMHARLIAILMTLAASSTVVAAIRTNTITYEHDGETLQGYFAYDDAHDGKRPGVLVVHEWWGHNDYARRRARELAELGYVAFALDMYGQNKLADTPDEARELATPFYRDRANMRTRAQAGLEQLSRHDRVDASRLGAIGYCFGGTVVLELARSGADVDGVVSFHGGLSTPNPDDAKNIRGEVLICNGADDAAVPAEQQQAFHKEMRDADVQYTFISYGGAVHAFTNPAADDVGMANVAYNERADRRSWGHMEAFFEAVLGESK